MPVFGSRKPINFSNSELRNMYLLGESLQTLADKAGVSRTVIRLRLEETNTDIRSPGRCEDSNGLDSQTLQRLYIGDGLNAREISKLFGVPRCTIYDRMKRYRISRRPSGVCANSPNSRIDVKECIRLSLSGIKYAELSERYEVSYSAVAKAMAKAGHRSPRDKKRIYGKECASRPGKRAQVLKSFQDMGTELECQICGESRSFDMAHIVEHKDGGPMEVWNILLLCPNHHRFFDRGSLTAKEYSKIRGKVESAPVGEFLGPNG